MECHNHAQLEQMLNKSARTFYTNLNSFKAKGTVAEDSKFMLQNSKHHQHRNSNFQSELLESDNHRNGGIGAPFLISHFNVSNLKKIKIHQNEFLKINYCFIEREKQGKSI